MWLVLLGCHGAGKTTLGKALARYTGWAFHEELGRRLAEDRRWRPRGRSAASSQQEFDHELMRQELRRDLDWSPDVPRIIETWHPGNLAYASARGSLVAPELHAQIQLRCQAARTVVLPVLAPRDVLAGRQSEAGDLEFFLTVAGQSLSQAEALGLAMLPPVWTHMDSPDRIAARLAPRFLGQARRERTPHLAQGAAR